MGEEEREGMKMGEEERDIGLFSKIGGCVGDWSGKCKRLE